MHYIKHVCTKCKTSQSVCPWKQLLDGGNASLEVQERGLGLLYYACCVNSRTCFVLNRVDIWRFICSNATGHLLFILFSLPQRLGRVALLILPLADDYVHTCLHILKCVQAPQNMQEDTQLGTQD